MEGLEPYSRSQHAWERKMIDMMIRLADSGRFVVWTADVHASTLNLICMPGNCSVRRWMWVRWFQINLLTIVSRSRIVSSDCRGIIVPELLPFCTSRVAATHLSNADLLKLLASGAGTLVRFWRGMVRDLVTQMLASKDTTRSIR